MTFLSTSTLSIATLLVLFSATAHAGPCEHEIYDTDLALNKKLDAEAARGKAAPRPRARCCTASRPRFRSPARKRRLATFPKPTSRRSTYKDEARKADEGGDLPACHKALADARQMLGL